MEGVGAGTGSHPHPDRYPDPHPHRYPDPHRYPYPYRYPIEGDERGMGHLPFCPCPLPVQICSVPGRRVTGSRFACVQVQANAWESNTTYGVAGRRLSVDGEEGEGEGIKTGTQRTWARSRSEV
jgi:hypothetical protein